MKIIDEGETHTHKKKRQKRTRGKGIVKGWKLNDFVVH